MPDIDWQSLTARADTPLPLVLVTGACALLAVSIDSVWRRSRNVVTIVHEAGHAVVALLTGRELTGIRLHADTSGLTQTRGRASGFGAILTTAAGYLSPSIVGLAGVGLLAFGKVTIMLWTGTGVLLLMLFMVRNVYGAVLLLVTGAVVVAVSLYATTDVQAAFGYGMTWFLLLGAVRPVTELRRDRRRGRGAGSDAERLAHITRLPTGFWVAAFSVLTTGALLAGGYVLIVS
jgi:hypothetical protein